MISHAAGRAPLFATLQGPALSNGMSNHRQSSPEAVIFDVDGTLLDSVDKHAMSWVDAFQAFGHRVRFDEVRSQIGKGGDQLMPVFMTRQEIDEYGDDLERERGTILKTKYLSSIKPFSSVRALLERVRADGKWSSHRRPAGTSWRHIRRSRT